MTTAPRRPLRLMIYDRTCTGRGVLPGLTLTWKVGAQLYGALGRLDAWHGAASWGEALDWLATVRAGEPITEIQFWGHGNWGTAKIARERLDVSALEPPDPRAAQLAAVRARLVTGGDALWWFRTCETFGTEAGHAFARAWAGYFGCRVAGHTYVIALAQSGLHVLRPGEEPSWSVDEGLPRAEGGPPAKARWSGFFEPNTISCFGGRIPPGF